MLNRPTSLSLAFVCLLVVTGASCGGGGDERTSAQPDDQREEVTLVAKSSLVDPELSIDVQGDFVGPDRDAFSSHVLFGEVAIDQSVVIVGDQAWVRTGDKWEKKPLDSSDVKDSLDLSPGQLQFWTDFDPTDLAGFSGPREKLNGVDAIRISFTAADAKLLAKLFDANEKDLEGLQEFTMWLAEKDRWPVGLRAIFAGDQDFLSGGEKDTQPKASPPDNAPPKLLESYHYGLSVAMKKEMDGASAAPRFRIEFLMAISQVNDKTLVVTAPQ